ncbi:TldD/PmbA family protein [uncultured Sneathiella sp.]|mgnify:CR=1 FL=1|jgi:PmbA protein|uniref:TldD/PmbA family protein n=1 Tax=uncultured Sneathiella sp. TaxID=879315 RepID=UPI0030D7A039|tara:strand:- start:4303 stop:5658 length:1356 start_codon:yes stop_codon:yes gene_type:complete
MSEHTIDAQNSLNILDDLIAIALRKGAEAADAVRIQGTSINVSVRQGETEEIERSEAHDLGLRVLIGKQQAFVSSNDAKPEVLEELVDRAMAMARNMPEEKFCGLADPDDLATEFADLDLYDKTALSPEDLVQTAKTAEQAALDVNGVTNSEGGSASSGRASIALVTSGGFKGAYSSSSYSISASVIAGEGQGMERDYDYDSHHHFADLRSPEEIGRKAGERAVKLLNPRKMPSGQVPVVFSNRVSASILGHFSGAIAGAAIARGTSFLKDRMGEQVFPDNIRIIDDPHRSRGAASKPFDGEGVVNKRLDLVKGGTLQSWILNTSSAKQLGLRTNGRATRGTASPPGSGTTNLYMEAGNLSLEELIGDIKSGLFITSLIGFGVNAITGDYSRGASGFWIENGEMAFPVSELTIAGNLNDMFMKLTPADDLEFRQGTNAPSLRIDGMMVAGT